MCVCVCVSLTLSLPCRSRSSSLCRVSARSSASSAWSWRPWIFLFTASIEVTEAMPADTALNAGTHRDTGRTAARPLYNHAFMLNTAWFSSSSSVFIQKWSSLAQSEPNRRRVVYYSEPQREKQRKRIDAGEQMRAQLSGDQTLPATTTELKKPVLDLTHR